MLTLAAKINESKKFRRDIKGQPNSPTGILRHIPFLKLPKKQTWKLSPFNLLSMILRIHLTYKPIHRTTTPLGYSKEIFCSKQLMHWSNPLKGVWQTILWYFYKLTTLRSWGGGAPISSWTRAKSPPNWNARGIVYIFLLSSYFPRLSQYGIYARIYILTFFIERGSPGKTSYSRSILRPYLLNWAPPFLLVSLALETGNRVPPPRLNLSHRAN